jgi:hypothetical protein
LPCTRIFGFSGAHFQVSLKGKSFGALLQKLKLQVTPQLSPLPVAPLDAFMSFPTPASSGFAISASSGCPESYVNS